MNSRLDDAEARGSAGPLFDRHPARLADPATSQEAALRVGEFAARQHREILEALRKMPHGGTSDEIARAIALNKVQVARRMSELQRAGNVRDSGSTRPTPSGRQAIVWEAV